MSAEYTEEQRTEALTIYREHGPTEAERRLGIPRKTISSWARRRGVQRAGATVAPTHSGDTGGHARRPAADKSAGPPKPWKERRQELRGELDSLAGELVKRVWNTREASAAKSWMITYGIAQDKLEQLDANGPSGGESPTGGLIDEEVDRLLVEVAERDAQKFAEGMRQLAVALGHDPEDPEIRWAMRESLADLGGRQDEPLLTVLTARRQKELYERAGSGIAADLLKLAGGGALAGTAERAEPGDVERVAGKLDAAAERAERRAEREAPHEELPGAREPAAVPGGEPVASWSHGETSTADQERDIRISYGEFDR